MTVERARAAAAAAVSGLLFALAFPPYGLVLLLPLALVPWLAALAVEPSRVRALVSGLVFGMVYWCVSIRWITYVVTTYGGQSAAMGVVCLGILALILSQWPVLVAWVTVASAPPGSAVRLAVFPVLWMASEHARAVAYGGFPWNLTAHALFLHPAWLQTATLWGVYGVGALVAAVSALLAAAAVKRRLAPALAAATLALLAGVSGTARLKSPQKPKAELTVALLQPNLTEEMRKTPGGGAASYRSVLDQIRQAADYLPDLIAVPESAFPVYWQDDPSLRANLTAIARGGPSILFNDVEQESDGRYYNAARLLTGQGLAPASYRKVHLVPFGEYVPLPRVFFFVRQVSTEIGAFTAAEDPELLRAGPLALGMGICYEITYPSLSRREVAAGANLIATISNDSWYGRAGAQQQHFAAAVLRSIENDRDLIRAAITGISGIVDARGRIIAEAPPGERTIVSGKAGLRDTLTPWTRWGFWIPRAADAAAFGVLLFALARLRPRRPFAVRASGRAAHEPAHRT